MLGAISLSLSSIILHTNWKSITIKVQHVAIHHQLLDIYQLPKYKVYALILDNVYQKLQCVKCSFHNNYDDYVLCTACFRNSL